MTITIQNKRGIFSVQGVAELSTKPPRPECDRLVAPLANNYTSLTLSLHFRQV